MGFKWIYFILPLVLFFPLFQLGQNTQWGSSACLSPCTFQWWNGRCRNPKYLPHQRLPDFGEKKRDGFDLFSVNHMTRARNAVAESLLGSPHPGQSTDPMRLRLELTAGFTCSNNRVQQQRFFRKHYIDLWRKSVQKSSISSFQEQHLTKPGGLRTGTKHQEVEGIPHVCKSNWPAVLGLTCRLKPACAVRQAKSLGVKLQGTDKTPLPPS